MSVEVIVLLERSTETVTTADQPWHELDLARVDYLRWAKLAAEIAQRAARRDCFRVEVYLHFKGDYLLHKYEYDFVEKLIELAREHAWGGQVFLVLDQSIFKDPDEIRSSIPRITYWLETAWRGGASDVVLAAHSRFNPASPSPHLLKKAGSDSRQRYQDFLDLVAPGIWLCWAAPQTAINRFSLEDESLLLGNSVPDKNFLIAVDRKASISADEKKEIKRFVRKHRGGRFALAVVGIAASDLSPDLRALAAELSLRVIQFRGWLELRFFLLRLNCLCNAEVVLLPETIQAVPTRIVPQFGRADKAPPGLLITSSFNQQQDSILSREAARDVGRLLHAVHQQSNYLIHPALRGRELSGLLTTVSDLTAWWFIGHGEGGAGLQDVDGQVLSAGEWLDKFSDYGKNLPLVFFSACRSAEVARAFAHAGAGVSIGFDSDTLPAPCRILAIQVINAALISRGERNAILTAFSTGCRQLQVSGLGHVRPRAFYSIR